MHLIMKSWWWLTDLLKSVNISENMVFRKWLIIRALTSPIDSSIYDWRDEWAVLRWDIVTGNSLLLAGNYYVDSFVPACLPANPMDFLSKNSQQHSQPTMGSNCEPKYLFLPSQLSLLAVLQSSILTNKIFNYFQFPFNNLGTLVIYLYTYKGLSNRFVHSVPAILFHLTIGKLFPWNQVCKCIGMSYNFLLIYCLKLWPWSGKQYASLIITALPFPKQDNNRGDTWFLQWRQQMALHGSPLARPQSDFDGSQLPALSGWGTQIQLLIGEKAG